MVCKLSLGTAQWGLGYGITNPSGRINDSECASIIAVANTAGIDAVDTALSYGNAQVRLRPWARDMKISTKISGLNVESQFQECLDALEVSFVDSVLLHDWDLLNSVQRRGAVRELGRVHESDLVRRVGTSIYDESGIRSTLDMFSDEAVPLGIVQVQANALDRRLDGAAVMAELVEVGVRIQIRSVFLQGLLVGSTDSTLGLHPAVRTFIEYCSEKDLSPLSVALQHVRAIPWASEVVVGATTAAELLEIVEAWNSLSPMLAPKNLASDDVDLVDPRRWS